MVLQSLTPTVWDCPITVPYCPVVLCDCPITVPCVYDCPIFVPLSSQAVDQLGADNLVQEMGGTLAYSHETWLGNRVVRGSLAAIAEKWLSF